MADPSKIIILNGTSSSGKSTLAKALRPMLEPQFHYYAADQLADAGFRPTDRQTRFRLREAFFAGFHRSIAAFAYAGLDLLIEHIVEQPTWAEELNALLAPFDVFWIGVHAPIAEMRQRELKRGDRQVGEAEEHLKTHSWCSYDVDVDTTEPLEENVAKIMAAWHSQKAVKIANVPAAHRYG